MIEKITPVILTYNEVANIGRTLEQLRWASEIVVVDSFSDDGTLQVLSDYAQVIVPATIRKSRGPVEVCDE